jgi:hypothetical protein
LEIQHKENISAYKNELVKEEDQTSANQTQMKLNKNLKQTQIEINSTNA